MAVLLYNLFIRLYSIAAYVTALFNAKAALWLKGRNRIFLQLHNALDKDDAPRIWIHCASLGEFEQAKPVMEKLKADYPAYKLLLTFFSPSGYEIRKNYKGCDFIFYLPVDTKQNAIQFIDLVKPKLIVFIKYELWFNYLQQARQRNITMLLVSATFSSNMKFFKWYGGLFRTMLAMFRCIFVQTEEDKRQLFSIKINNVTISGDTRFDRVLETFSEDKNLDMIERFCKSCKVLIAGSTWREDDLVLDHYANTHTELRFIIAPHNIARQRINECKTIYKNSVLYSDYILTGETTCHTLIIDNIGLLKYLYRYATICFVGGAFGGDGIHNVLEAAVYGKPILFGPHHDNFPETFELVDNSAAFEIRSAVELEKTINKLLLNDELYAEACRAATDYVQSKKGATKIIMNYIHENRLLIR